MTISYCNNNTTNATNINVDTCIWGHVAEVKHSLVNNWLASKINEDFLINKIREVSEHLKNNEEGIKSFTLMVAGGIMRDTLLEQPYKDVDVFVHSPEGSVLPVIEAIQKGKSKSYLNKGSWIEKSHIYSIYTGENTNIIGYYDDTPEEYAPKDLNEFILNQFNISATRIGFSMDFNAVTGELTNPRWYCNREDVKDFLLKKVIYLYDSVTDTEEDVIKTVNKYKTKSYLEGFTIHSGKNSTCKVDCVINNVKHFSDITLEDVKAVPFNGTSFAQKALLAKEEEPYVRKWMSVLTPTGLVEKEL